MQAHAVVFPRAHTVEFRSVTCPDPGPDDVVVETAYSWISNGTEGSYLRGERIAGDTAFRPGDALPFPVVAGYQKTGQVTWVGDHVKDLQIGETVFAATSRVDGMFHATGGHVSPSVGTRDQIWKLPAQPDPLAFAGMVLTQVGYNCGTRPRMQPGDAVVVMGDGLVGHWAAQTLSLRGARVVMVGRHPDRLAQFRTSPTHYRVHERSKGFPAALADLRLPPLQVVVDTVGSVPGLQQLQPFMARGGQIVSAGFYGTADAWSLQELRNQELSLHAVAGWTRSRMNQTRKLIGSGQLQTLPLITHRFPVQEAAAAWALIQSKTKPCLGVVLDWTSVAHA